MRKLFKKLTLICATVAVVSVMMPTVAMAQANAINIATCPELNKPETTKDYIITVLEEEIGTAPVSDASAESLILACYRETTCNTVDGKRTCTSEYKGDCAPGGNPEGTQTLCQRVQVLIARSGASLLYMYIGLIYRWAAGVIGIVSVLYMVYGGIKIAAAGDNAGAIDEAKTKIMQSIAGLILLFLSAVILYTINPNFFTA